MNVKPNSNSTFDLLLTTLNQVSHHDPAQNDGSNTLTFNRQKQFVMRETTGGTLTQEMVDQFCQANPVPLDLVDIVQPLKFSEFTAVALVRVLIDLYNSAEGTGLFSGVGRYEMMETRIHSAAVRSSTMARLWAVATRDLQFPIHGVKYDEVVMQFFALPLVAQEAAIMALMDEYRSIVTIARVWSAKAKLGIPEYAAAARQSALPGMNSVQVLRYNADDLAETKHRMVLDVPAVSANSLRHQVVRYPAWVHLVNALELTTVPPGVEAIFVNGGNIRAGAKQPSGAAQLALGIREMYPTLDLLGGVTDSFDLGEGRLSVASWIVCRENLDALIGTPAENIPTASTSIFDMLDDVTHTRQATENGLGQMIWNFETLPKGLNILVRLSLHPFTAKVTRSALAAAVERFVERAVVGGQAARGFGWCLAEWMGNPELSTQAYTEYLDANREALREGIASGMMGTKMQVIG